MIYVKTYYDRDSLKDLIRNGRQPVPRLDTSRPRPPLYMPAWKDRVSEEELDDLVEYLFSLYDQVAQGQPTTQSPNTANP
ncbi:MAG: cytochrome c [Candidatus Omnitrophica bacterium]|nr:cytochrome c [Candidatus Omnitrophota bacterium]